MIESLLVFTTVTKGSISVNNSCSHKSELNISIYNLAGITYWYETGLILDKDQISVFNIIHLKSGVYILKITYKDKIFIERFIL